MATIRTVLNYLEEIAPSAYQESYDNAKLIVGNANAELTGILVCLDSIEAIIDEAIEKGCNLVVAHHPIVFSGLKQITGRNYIERVILKAIKNDIAIYAIHTNLDNVIYNGVNSKIAEKLGLQNTQILAPKKGILQKLYTFVPKDKANELKKALFAAGAGQIGNYDECSFGVEGVGTFRGGEGTNPTVGDIGKRHQEAEQKIEVIFPAHLQSRVVRALIQAHPYEEVAYDVIALENQYMQVGSGMVGELAEAVDSQQFLKNLKEKMQTACVRYTNLCKKNIKRIAICGGAGSFLLKNAIRAKADIFITGDYKYHQFFDADGQIIIADIGHFESEQFTIDLLYDLLMQKFTTFAIYRTSVNTNPINYL
ncbi:MAG: Nif3-like dinuclear metal center hexameric protein [Aureispira sp.]|nr:Nif3-like dinuclear metal center hexameric protein [Aureispira sp.]